MPGMVSIEPDDRGFWHVNYWAEHPHVEDVPPDGFATTAKGGTLDDAIALAKKFTPSSVYVWEACRCCGGTRVDAELDGEECLECEDGLECRQLSKADIT